MESSFRKIVQKKTYDILSHKYGLILVIVGAFALGVSAFHFGEAVADWSREKYAAVFNSFSDNLAGTSFRKRLCLPVPIDVVYTWVNGTDETLVSELRRVKRDLELELNITREEKCTFSNCVQASVAILEPGLLPRVRLKSLQDYLPLFTLATSLQYLQGEGDDKTNITAVFFGNSSHVDSVLKQKISFGGHNITVSRGFYTSDSTLERGILMKNTVIISRFPHQFTVEQLQEKLPNPVDKIEMFSDKGIAVLHVSKKEDFDSLLNLKNFTIEGKEPVLHAARLVWDLRDLSKDEDIAASRFEDNEELRYSIRSVEKYAPWVRHIYIVTNGQIPYWLDMENPRVTVVTHEEIFPNSSHLPTYSSPAIESHLHRIPGLSDKFIYLNDDVMFGSEVWPDDFFSYSTGQKVYLTWPVPNCNEGCPSTWIKDGYCDKACNTSECDWDAGDCAGANGHVQLGAGFQGGYHDASVQALAYCNTGCANNWIADKYCDTACNIKKCGFDAGDCGTKDFDKLYKLHLTFDENRYKLPPGEFVAYFNLTDVVKTDGMITQASYNSTNVVRQVAVGNKYKVLTVVLQQEMNATTLKFQIQGHQGTNMTFRFNFTLEVNTSKTAMELYEKENLRQVNITENKTREEEEDDIVLIPDIPDEKLGPKPDKDKTNSPVVLPAVAEDFDKNFTDAILPPVIKEELNSLNQALKHGDLTQKGYDLAWKILYLKYLEIKDDPLHIKAGKEANVSAEYPNHHVGVKDMASNVTSQGQKPPSMRKLLALPPAWREVEGNWSVGYKLHDLERDLDMEAKDDTVIDEQDTAVFMDKVKVGRVDDTGSLPWERGNSLTDLQKIKEDFLKTKEFETPSRSGRQILDTFGDSLRHVNKLYNAAFGFAARKVPAHMPHMIDKHIMAELHARFPHEWDVTSSHKVRHSKDMQYAFAYFYYLMGVTEVVSVEQVFDDMDTDHSKVLSDRELRTLAAKLYDLPLYLETLQGLEKIMINCSEHLSEKDKAVYPPPTEEVYYDKSMPQVTRSLFLNCGEVRSLVKEKFKPRPKYKYTTVDDSDVTFFMIRTNVSSVVGQLDTVRKHTKKFICLNDNIEHGSEEAKTVKAVLQDFYESLFPIQSQVELPREYRNRFLHVRELREWRKYRDWLKFWTHLALVVLVIFTIVSYFGEKIEAAYKRLSRQSNRENAGSSQGSASSANDSGSSGSQSKHSPLLTV